jgi:hypothetical protein
VAEVTDGDPGHRSDDDGAGDAGEYCRAVEAYLCRKNDGHLIRIAGPSFSRVSGWAEQGIPLNVVYRGVDRYFERYHARGQRRRPVHIDFCEGDVLTVFDEWRRAVGFQGGGGRAQPETDRRTVRAAASRGEGDSGDAKRAEPARAASLSAHLERVIVRLTTLRAGGRLTAGADAVVDAAIRDLDSARGSAARLEGDARVAFVGRLRDLDAQLVTALRDGIGQPERREIEREAQAELEAFRAGMAADAYERAVAVNCVRLLRQRTGLPVIAYED